MTVLEQEASLERHSYFQELFTHLSRYHQIVYPEYFEEPYFPDWDGETQQQKMHAFTEKFGVQLNPLIEKCQQSSQENCERSILRILFLAEIFQKTPIEAVFLEEKNKIGSGSGKGVYTIAENERVVKHYQYLERLKLVEYFLNEALSLKIAGLLGVGPGFYGFTKDDTKEQPLGLKMKRISGVDAAEIGENIPFVTVQSVQSLRKLFSVLAANHLQIFGGDNGQMMIDPETQQVELVDIQLAPDPHPLPNDRDLLEVREEMLVDLMTGRNRLKYWVWMLSRKNI